MFPRIAAAHFFIFTPPFLCTHYCFCLLVQKIHTLLIIKKQKKGSANMKITPLISWYIYLINPAIKLEHLQPKMSNVT